MGEASRAACGAVALLMASAVWPQTALAQPPSFEPLRPTGGRFQIIGGGVEVNRTKPTPVAFPAPRPSEAAPAAPLPKAAAATSKPVPVPLAPAASQPPQATQVTPAPPSPAEATGPVQPSDLLAALAEPEPISAPPEAEPAAYTGSVPASPAGETPVAIKAAAPAAVDANMRLVASGNALMAEALRRARETRDTFLRAVAEPPQGASGFAVKVAVGPRDMREILWLTGLERSVQRNILLGTSERWSGQLANEPTQVQSLKMGDRIGFEVSEIRDWTYTGADGRPLGNFSACALTAQDGRAKLAELVRSTGIDCGWTEQAMKSAAR